MLRTLDLTGHGLGDAAAELILASPHLTPQTRLVLRGNGINDNAGHALEDRFGASVGRGRDWQPRPQPPRPPAPPEEIPF